MIEITITYIWKQPVGIIASEHDPTDPPRPSPFLLTTLYKSVTLTKWKPYTQRERERERIKWKEILKCSVQINPSATPFSERLFTWKYYFFNFYILQATGALTIEGWPQDQHCSQWASRFCYIELPSRWLGREYWLRHISRSCRETPTRLWFQYVQFFIFVNAFLSVSRFCFI